MDDATLTKKMVTILANKTGVEGERAMDPHEIKRMVWPTAQDYSSHTPRVIKIYQLLRGEGLAASSNDINFHITQQGLEAYKAKNWSFLGESPLPTLPKEISQTNESNSRVVIDPKKVFVVHGRNLAARDAMFTFLRAIGLHPLEWGEAVKLTGQSAPYIGQVLETAFSEVQAVVALFSGDDEAKLRDDFIEAHDPEYEKRLTLQARPNVLFEAGMAFAVHSERTIIVELGILRPFSDIAGRNTIKFDATTQKRQALADRLRTAGCAVNLEGTDWHTAGTFPPTSSTKIAPDPQSSASKKKLKHDGMRYWQVDQAGEIIKETGAYCPICLDGKNKEIRLLELPNGYFNCGVCNKTYGKWKEGDSAVQLVAPRRVRRSHFE